MDKSVGNNVRAMKDFVKKFREDFKYATKIYKPKQRYTPHPDKIKPLYLMSETERKLATRDTNKITKKIKSHYVKAKKKIPKKNYKLVGNQIFEVTNNPPYHNICESKEKEGDVIDSNLNKTTETNEISFEVTKKIDEDQPSERKKKKSSKPNRISIETNNVSLEKSDFNPTESNYVEDETNKPKMKRKSKDCSDEIDLNSNEIVTEDAIKQIKKKKKRNRGERNLTDDVTKNQTDEPNSSERNYVVCQQTSDLKSSETAAKLKKEEIVASLSEITDDETRKGKKKRKKSASHLLEDESNQPEIIDSVVEAEAKQKKKKNKKIKSDDIVKENGDDETESEKISVDKSKPLKRQEIHDCDSSDLTVGNKKLKIEENLENQNTNENNKHINNQTNIQQMKTYNWKSIPQEELKIDETIEIIYAAGRPIGKEDAKKLVESLHLLRQRVSIVKRCAIFKTLVTQAEKKLIKEKKKLCYKCRRCGHSTLECSKAKEKLMRCLKCGKNTHIMKDCKLTSEDYPFADCLNCLGKGHISQQCFYKEIIRLKLELTSKDQAYNLYKVNNKHKTNDTKNYRNKRNTKY